MTEIAANSRFVGGLDDLETATGATYGPSGLIPVSQERIQLFADATDDHQWIHVDGERAARGPFGTTIAHGYLTLSLVPHFLAELIDVRGAGMGINYGLNKVRFPAPLPSGSRAHASVTITAVKQSAAAAQVTLDVTIRADGIEKPVCVAQVVVLYAA